VIAGASLPLPVIRLTFHRPEAAPRTVGFNALPLKDPTGENIGVVYVAIEGTGSGTTGEVEPVSPRSHKEEDANLAALTFRIDAVTLKITSMNQSVLYLLGYAPQDFYADSKLLAARVLPEYHEAFNESLKDAGRGVARSIEVGLARRDNDTVILALMLYPGRNRQGEVVSIEGIGRDITARKAAEQQLELSLMELRAAYDRLEAQHDELQSLDRLKSQVLANVSHELRTPLVTIRGYNELMLHGELGSLTDRQRKGLEISSKSIHRLLALIENLIDFARLEKDRYRLPRERIDLCALVTEVLTEVADSMREKNLSVAIDLPSESVTVLGDRSRLKQTFRNLIDNAEKFSETGGKVMVGVETTGRGAEVRVSDTGIGIPETEREKIFDKFYQVDGSSTRQYPGLGIGLAIVREVIELHGGSVAVESEIGKGSVFVVQLPRIADETTDFEDNEKTRPKL
jgi:PAS domain S-box-containing protein